MISTRTPHRDALTPSSKPASSAIEFKAMNNKVTRPEKTAKSLYNTVVAPTLRNLYKLSTPLLYYGKGTHPHATGEKQMHTKTDRTRTTAERIRAQRGLSNEQKIRDTETPILQKWARKNAPGAIAELERRAAEAQTAWANSLKGMGIIPPAPLDIGV